MRKSLLSVLFLLVAAYAGICLYLYSHQRALLYFGQVTRVEPSQTDFSLVRGDITLRGWVSNPGQPRALLYFGGNGESIQDNRGRFLQWFPRHTVYLLAYRGYGASDGEPEEPLLFADALALYDHVHAAHPHLAIDVIGRSLGTGVASYVASQRPVARLVLVTPFDNMAEVAQARYPWLPVGPMVKDRYASDHYLAEFRGPVLVVRAGRDRVIAWARTQALIKALPRPPRVLELPRAGHNSVQDFPAYAKALSGFVEPPGIASGAVQAR